MERLFHVPLTLWRCAGAVGSVFAMFRGGSGVALVKYTTSLAECRVEFVELSASSSLELDQNSALEILSARECPVAAADDLKNSIDSKGLGMLIRHLRD